jgi:hypothetical protein
MFKVSRHARNNMRLYEIHMNELSNTINAPDVIETEGDKIVAIKRLPGKFSGYPLKVVYKKRKGDDIFVITAYPLKRKHWR